MIEVAVQYSIEDLDVRVVTILFVGISVPLTKGGLRVKPPIIGMNAFAINSEAGDRRGPSCRDRTVESGSNHCPPFAACLLHLNLVVDAPLGRLCGTVISFA